MLALSFTFPAGRYHATPWNRHVNEGSVAWPPEPWRILRALIATWHHKVKHTGQHDPATLTALIDALAENSPEYSLPAASHSHVRHYMPQWKAGDTKLVFDAFTAVDRHTPLVVTWPQQSLADEQQRLLDDLLAVMGYLGRAESWVEAKCISEPPPANCKPGTQALDTDTGEIHGEPVSLLSPLAATDYLDLRERFLVDKKATKKLGPTLPDTLLEALSLDTSQLRKRGWNRPPAAQPVTYLRPVDALQPVRHAQVATTLPATTVSFILVGKPLPRVEDSLRIGELSRMAIMSRAKKRFGADAIPRILSGHGLPAGNRHHHAFFLPLDSNHDGRIDRLLIHFPGGMDQAMRQTIESLDHLWQRNGPEWQLILEGTGAASAVTSIATPSTQWVSTTPYLHPWHAKKRFSVEDQIRRECRERGLPEPDSITPLSSIDVGNNRLRKPIHFHRHRNKRVNHQPDRLGSFWHLEFPEPVDGPMALGFACHYGLGLFQPCDAKLQK